mgnify:CR=1 FL=1|jgi:NAD(P)H-hydrate epimerase
MQYVVTSAEMRRCDQNTSEHFGMDSKVLMERAALAVAARIGEWKTCQETTRALRALVAFGHGNNGGDGVAVGRILAQHGYQVTFMAVGEGGVYSELTRQQMDIVRAYGYEIDTFSNIRENKSQMDWDIIVDAMFGIGCNRPLEYEYEQAVKLIDNIKKIRRNELLVCAVDMPSGISADDGKVCGVAVHADVTVTFNFAKVGQVMYPGCDYTGKLYVEDAGITQAGFLGEIPGAFLYDETAAELLPGRAAYGNKSTFGRILIVAGSSEISGACTLCATTCYRSGAGMVRIFTAKENRETIQTMLPEALLDTYTADTGEEHLTRTCTALRKAMKWSSALCIGPGIGTDTVAHAILETVLREYTHSIVLDADALNLIAEDETLQKLASEYSDSEKWVIMTPHVAEFARLYGSTVAACKDHILAWPRELAEKYHCTVICKDARTVVAGAQNSQIYLNVSGNSGMATAGSGDVLTGLLGALSVCGEDGFKIACMGSYLHGLAGNLAAREYGEYYMLAGDIMKALQQVLPEK